MKVNWNKAKAYEKDFKKGLCSSMPLSHAFFIFDLTKKDDFASISKLINGHVQCSSLTGYLSYCRVDYEGFCRIWDYAKEKEELLKEFHREFVKNYIMQLENRMAREARGED